MNLVHAISMQIMEANVRRLVCVKNIYDGNRIFLNEKQGIPLTYQQITSQFFVIY